MFNDIDWTRKGNDGFCISNLENVKEDAKRFSQGHWTFLGPGDEKKWYGNHHTLQCGCFKQRALLPNHSVSQFSIYGAILGGTIIGPVIEVQIVKILDPSIRLFDLVLEKHQLLSGQVCSWREEIVQESWALLGVALLPLLHFS